MSDVHEDKVKKEELDQEPNTLNSYDILVKQLVSTFEYNMAVTAD